MMRSIATFFAVLVTGGSPLTVSVAHAETPATPAQVDYYQKQVLPVLQQHCLKCHGAEPKVKGGLNLMTRQAVIEGGDSGTAFDAKNPAASTILVAIGYKDEGKQMPPKGKLPEKDAAVITKWVMDGLAFPEGEMGSAPAPAKPKGGVVTEEAKQYWAYQPVKRPTLPAVKDKEWVKTPVDAFVLAGLEKNGLKPVKPADRVALVRRAYYDLTGLPPTPEQVDAFVRDTSPNAWEKLIDQLLASPHYGEKWGKHWLDVVRFAETNGYERDAAKPVAWKYRDYVVRSFNADKPYDRFVKEQLAGDEMPEVGADAIIATGFYRLGVWDDEPADRELALYDGYDDLVTVTGQAFLAMTLNCARCHDHKVDPIPQADYYKTVALFRDVRPFSNVSDTTVSTNCRDITSPERRALYENELKERQKRIADIDTKMKPIEDAAIKKMSPEDQLKVDDGKRAEVVKKVPSLLDAEQKKTYRQLIKERAELTAKPIPHQEFALAVNLCETRPPATFILARGNPAGKGKEVQPGFPDVLSPPPFIIPEPKQGAKSSGRRTAFANWIASPENPLTARVFVNRVWQHHFGKGIVPTTNDFGKLGDKPSNPELLNYLAAEFTQPTWRPNDGAPWQLKRLHKLMMLSSTYQLSSISDPAALKSDPGNTHLWRANMRRLNAEEVRDSFLVMSGELDLKVGGPSVFPKIPKEVLAGQSVPGSGWHVSAREEQNRRSVYVHVKRSLQVPILATHDQADTDSSCPVRYVTTVPTQALGLLNGEFANETAAAFARRLTADRPDNLQAQIERAIRLTTGRLPKEGEVARDLVFINSLKEKHGLDDRTALVRYCLLMLNANEFVYLD